MKIKKNILLSLFLSFLLFSCDLYIFDVIMDGDFKKNINLECGKFDISCNIIANRQIKIEQKMELNFPVLINPERLKLTYKGHTNNNAKIYLNGALIEKAEEINGYNRMAIVIDGIFQRGDTLKVNIDNFIVCREKPIEIGDINFVFVSRRK
jgi:hypothetical protein